tara:strand:+ start:204 stop:314 length:111 start_codon:yes stop_codon:yes gene_type:complete
LTNPVDGLCTNSPYGIMPDWDVSNVTEEIIDSLDKN